MITYHENRILSRLLGTDKEAPAPYFLNNEGEEYNAALGLAVAGLIVVEETDRQTTRVAKTHAMAATDRKNETRLNFIVAKNSAFATMKELLNAPGNYRPSLNCDKAELEYLADEYDRRQEERRDDRRAFRNYSPKKIR